MLCKVCIKVGSGLKSVVISLCITILLACCQRDSEGEVLAEVFGERLLLSQVQEALPFGLQPQDSTLFVRHYTEQWIEKQVLWHAADRHVRKNYAEAMQQYRQSLTIYDYRQEILNEYLDTVVAVSEVEEYYQTHKENFRLEESILRCLYVKLAIKDAAQVNKIKKILFSETPPTDQYIQELYYSSKQAVNTFFYAHTWLRMRDLFREIPTVSSQISALETQRYVEIKDKNFIYLMRVLEYKSEGSPSPFILEQDKIRQAIINKRKQDILNNLKTELLKSAEENNNIRRYL